MARSDSTTGDLVRGLAELHVGDNATAQRIARMLSAMANEALPQRERDDTPPPSTRAPIDADAVAPLTRPPVAAPHDEPMPSTFQLRLRRVLPPPQAPDWLKDVDALSPTAPDIAPVGVPPLLHPARQRTLLIEMVATRAPGDDIDLPALTAQLAAGLPPQRLPYLPQRTLQQGLTLLFDHRLGMAPYRADQQGLLQLARSLMPDERVRAGRFEGVPGRAAAFDRVRWLGAAAEGDPQVPVLVLSDLSAGGPLDDEARASGFEWAAWLSQARAEQRRVRVLLPRAAARWPAACAGDPALLEWSHALSLADLRRGGWH